MIYRKKPVDVSYQQRDLSLQMNQLEKDYDKAIRKADAYLFPSLIRKKNWRRLTRGRLARWLDEKQPKYLKYSFILAGLLAVCVLLVSVQAVFMQIHPAENYAIPFRESTAKSFPDMPSGSNGDISPNTDDAQALTALPGIGQVIAQRIVDCRESDGAYYYPEDLLSIPGVGEKKLKDILPFLALP